MRYWIATVTGTLDILPAVKTTGTASEAAIPAGTVTFICNRGRRRRDRKPIRPRCHGRGNTERERG